MNLFAEVRECSAFAWEAIRANLLRSILTTVGIVIGIVTVTLMAAALDGVKATFTKAISFLGTDVLYVDTREWFVKSEKNWDAAQKRNRITLANVRALERVMDRAAGIAPTVMHNVGVAYKNQSSNSVMLIGTNEQFLTTGGVVLASGRFMTKREAYANRDVCIIGADVAEKLFLGANPLGEKLRAGQESLEVIGVLEKRGSVFGGISFDNQILIPIGKMIVGYRHSPSCTIQVKVGDPTRVDAALQELRGHMRVIRKVPPGEADDFAINQQEALLKQFDKVGVVVAATGFSITGLSLLVGGIGIMNIMFVSVAERTREIGIRKAIGARRRTILMQFLMEAAGICFIGGVIAVLIAWGIVALAQMKFPEVTLSPRIVLIALSVAASTGIISGFLPAWRAARMNPVDALRNE